MAVPLPKINKKNVSGGIISVRLAKIIFANLFYYLTYFCYYSYISLYFLVLFISFTVLFQLTFTFIYSTFNKKISISVK